MSLPLDDTGRPPTDRGPGHRRRRDIASLPTERLDHIRIFADLAAGSLRLDEVQAVPGKRARRLPLDSERGEIGHT